MKPVCVYVDTSRDVGDVNRLRVFASPEVADEWFAENDPEGAAFKYEVLG
jgi:hypothetical protein